MIERARPRDKICIQSKRRNPMRMLVEREQLFPLDSIPNLHGPIAAGSIQNASRTSASTPSNDIHARGMTAEGKEGLAQGGRPHADGRVLRGRGEARGRWVSVCVIVW